MQAASGLGLCWFASSGFRGLGEGLGFGVWGLGFASSRFRGLGEGLGFGVWGLGPFWLRV